MTRLFGRDTETIYFHGVPGAPLETALFGQTLADRLAGIYLFDRCTIGEPLSGDAYFVQLAKRISGRFPDRHLRLVGFSLGASAALRIAPHLGPQVTRLDLISAAAPFTLGNYLHAMAGAPVFRMAMVSPVLLGLLTWLQSQAARAMPDQLYSVLFNSARGEDAVLARDPVFKTVMLRILRHCLTTGLPSYRREIELYTRDWAFELDRVSQPVWIHHGREDNWAPVAMASDLAARVPHCADLKLIDGQ